MCLALVALSLPTYAASVVTPRGTVISGVQRALRSRSSRISVMSAGRLSSRLLCWSCSAEQAVYFVMGGPGSGKGTQCAKLTERYGMVHLSAGDLLRAEVASGSKLGQEISSIIDQGQIVRSETTVALLRNAMAGESGPFLIDGFPRSLENLEAFEADVGNAAFMLFLKVSEEEMEKRLLKRGETSGRSDDNARRSSSAFVPSMSRPSPWSTASRERGMLREVDAGASEDVVFERVCEAFSDQDLDEQDTSAAGASAPHAATAGIGERRRLLALCGEGSIDLVPVPRRGHGPARTARGVESGSALELRCVSAPAHTLGTEQHHGAHTNPSMH